MWDPQGAALPSICSSGKNVQREPGSESLLYGEYSRSCLRQKNYISQSQQKWVESLILLEIKWWKIKWAEKARFSYKYMVWED